MKKQQTTNGEKNQCPGTWTRRDFIQRAAMGTAGIALAGPLASCGAQAATPRSGMGNLFKDGDKPLLVVVEGDNLEKMLEAGIDALGGLEKLVSGKKVILKPNVVASQPYPVTTDVDLMLSLGEQLEAAGARAVEACDGNSSGVSKAGKFEALGFPQRLKTAGIGLTAVDFGSRLDHVFVKKSQWLAHPQIGVARTLQEADVIINLPVIKRHDAARFTCALKNHFGSVYGPLRFVAHNKMRDEDGAHYFDRALAEFADAVRPELTIVDARSLLIRGGPSLSGKAEIKEGVNRLIFCGDMLATDVYCSKVMEEHDDSYSIEMIEAQLEAAKQLELGARDLKDVSIKEITV